MLKMNTVNALMTPINAIVDLDSLGLVTGAKQQLRGYTLGDLLLVTDYFTRHDRLNQVGDVLMEKIRLEVMNSEEYQAIAKHL